LGQRCEICPKVKKPRKVTGHDAITKKPIRTNYYKLPPIEESRCDFEISLGMEGKINWSLEIDLDENDMDEAQSATEPYITPPWQDANLH
jgi:hypothetical protein